MSKRRGRRGTASGSATLARLLAIAVVSAAPACAADRPLEGPELLRRCARPLAAAASTKEMSSLTWPLSSTAIRTASRRPCIVLPFSRRAGSSSLLRAARCHRARSERPLGALSRAHRAGAEKDAAVLGESAEQGRDGTRKLARSDVAEQRLERRGGERVPVEHSAVSLR
jgi:hypothetical protein